MFSQADSFGLAVKGRPDVTQATELAVSDNAARTLLGGRRAGGRTTMTKHLGRMAVG